MNAVMGIFWALLAVICVWGAERFWLRRNWRGVRRDLVMAAIYAAIAVAFYLWFNIENYHPWCAGFADAHGQC